ADRLRAGEREADRRPASLEMTPFALDDVGAGPPALLLHGFPTTRRLWKDVAPRLVSAGMRVIAPDLLGYGDSPGDADVGMKAQAAALLDLLDQLGVQRAAVFAHDVGTAAAQILTVRAPARLRATAVPIRVIWGAGDAYLPLETVGRPLADALDARITVLPGGHFLPLDNPERVVAELLLEA